MVLYRYVKAPPKKPASKTAKRVVSSVFMLIGIFLLIWVSYPIISFEITSRVKFAQIISPVPDRSVSLSYALANADNIAEQVLGSSTEDIASNTDYTKASNWYPSKPQGNTNTAGRIYSLSIPKLRIKDAIVKIAGDDLNESLIHYGGTGLPGEYGTAVIFGHSILPQFYDPNNYKAIFSLLPKLDQGDEIFVKYDGITYRYVITNMWVTGPDDITVLEQRYDSSYIRLITCVPPGTYWKRLAVTARLQPI